MPSTNLAGLSSSVVLTGFGKCGPGLLLTAPGSGVFTVEMADAWYMYTMSTDAILRGITFNVTNAAILDIDATVSPYVVIATAPSESKTFTFVDETLTYASASYLGGVVYPEFDTMIAGSSVALNVPLTQGTQVAITFGITTTGTALTQSVPLIMTGSLFME